MNHNKMRGVYDRLIAVDLDGTLLQPDNSVSLENLDAINRAGQQRTIVVVVTGRPYVSADKIARRFSLPPVPIVSFNGAVIRRPDSGEILHQSLLSAEFATEILNECLRQDRHVHFYVDDTMYVNRNDRWTRLYCERSEMEHLVVDDMRVFTGQAAIKLLAIDEPEQIGPLFQACHERWTGRVYVTRSMPEYIEFLSPQATKGHALDWLIDFFGIERENTLAIGDAMNDLPLFERAGSSVAMPQGNDALKSLAHFVPPQQRTGVAAAIDWFLDTHK